MRIGIVHTRDPFAPGDEAGVAAALGDALVAAGHEAVPLGLPLRWDDPLQMVEQVLAVRLLGIGNLDRVIVLGFPAMCVNHHHRYVWQVEAGASAVCASLPATPRGDDARAAMMRVEAEFLGRAVRAYAASAGDAARMREAASRDVAVLPLPGDADAWAGVVAELTR